MTAPMTSLNVASLAIASFGSLMAAAAISYAVPGDSQDDGLGALQSYAQRTEVAPDGAAGPLATLSLPNK